ncbi:MAG TPA: PIG-L family deacetylase [Terriglobia bacterium]|nr:PIG-L family deacetylase [Terriglobia bacterium]
MKPSVKHLLLGVILTVLVAIVLKSLPMAAQSPRAAAIEPSAAARPLLFDRGSAALWQTLKKLHTRASLIMFTAHPDDEDGGMLAYESRGQGARVALMTLNRGEGGANVMSADYWDALGLVRTEELLAAGRYYGVQQFFSRAIDYGFSKTKEEALDKWGHDRVLYDSVRVVRMTRPLVVTSVFVGGVTDGHGNHQVAGQMAQEVYNAAGDPSMFPDQIQAGLRPWAPVKVYARVPFEPVTAKGVYDYATGKWSPAGVYNYVEKRWEPGQPATNLEIPEGDYAPMFGQNYLQISRTGLGFQRSQSGGASVPAAGQQMSPYHRYASRVTTSDHEKSFFDGIDISLMGIASLAQGGDDAFLKEGLAKINGLVEDAMKNFSADQPEKIAPTLAEGLKATNALIDQVQSSGLSDDSKYNVTHELKVKQAQFNNAIAQALGFSMQATVAPEHEPTGPFAAFMGTLPSFQVAIPGQRFWVKVHAAIQSAASVQLTKIALATPPGENWTVESESASSAPGGNSASGGAHVEVGQMVEASGGATTGELGNNKPRDQRFEVTAAANATFTRPYFTRPDIEQAYYDVVDPRYANLPLAPYPLSAWVDFNYQGVPVEVGQVVQAVERETGPGTVLNPLVIGPAISVAISPHAGVTPLDERSFGLNVVVHSNVKGPAAGSVRLELPAGWTASPSTAHFSTAQDGEDEPLSFQVHPSNLQEKPYTVTAVAEYNGHEYKEGYHTVGYQGLRPYNLYRSASYRTTGTDVKVAPGLNVGYIMGSGDDVPQSLENLGIKAHMLASSDLATGDLSKYNIVLLGVRTYAVRQDLITYNGRLLDYVKNGGVVVVEYNTPEFDHNFGPYPYSMTENPEEVTDETSKVTILDPSNPVFVWPNKITTKDFNGWVEERGSKFMKTWDPHYTALLETHDPGQDPQKGGLLYARYGKGIYVYCAYAFYRQLPEGVPGAYRLFANLVSLPKNPHAK